MYIPVISLPRTYPKEIITVVSEQCLSKRLLIVNVNCEKLGTAYDGTLKTMRNI